MSVRELLNLKKRSLRLSLTSFLCLVGGFIVGCWFTLYGVAERSLRSPTSLESSQSLDPGLPPPDSLLLLSILILSSPRNFEARDTIRSTWVKLNPFTFTSRHFFLIGTLGLGEQLMIKLRSESDSYGDLILLPDLKDSFDTLTEKVVKGLKVLDTTHPSSYVLKCDDDSFVRTDAVVAELQIRQQLLHDGGKRNCFQWGFFDGRAPVQKRGKWKEADYNLCDLYIPYALGGGYVISRECVLFINSNVNYLKMFKNEDVTIGTWLAVIGPERKHDVRFDTQYDTRGCSNKYLVQHKITLSQMTERYNNLVFKGKLCSEEIKKRSSWEYNWDAHPSRCCKLNESII